MRVLQIVPQLEIGGAEQTTVDIAHALVEASHDAWVISQGGRMVAGLPEAAHHITMPVASKNPVAILANARKIGAHCRREGIQLIHARSRAPAWSALMAARQSGIPFVTTYHGAYKARTGLKRLYNSVMARGDRVIANSQFTADRIAAQFPFARDRLVVIPRGTDFSRYDGSAEPYDWSLPSNARIVVQISRLTEWKGQRVAIGALKELQQDVHLVLAGEDQGRTDFRQGLVDLADQLGVSNRMHLVGHVDPPRALATADVCIVPSTEPEAFGRAAVEAQAAGIPVVVSALGAVGETVLVPPVVDPEERTGWHVPAGDPQALAGGIAAGLSLEGDALHRHIDRAKAHVHAQFSLSAMCETTLSVYSDLIG